MRVATGLCTRYSDSSGDHLRGTKLSYSFVLGSAFIREHRRNSASPTRKSLRQRRQLRGYLCPKAGNLGVGGISFRGLRPMHSQAADEKKQGDTGVARHS